jgi:hypothetical protein
MMKTIVPEGQEYRNGFRASGHLQDRREPSAAPHGDRRSWGFRSRRRGEFTRRLAECASSSHEFRSMLYAALDRPYLPNEAGPDRDADDGGAANVLFRIFERLRNG